MSSEALALLLSTLLAAGTMLVCMPTLLLQPPVLKMKMGIQSPLGGRTQQC